MCKRAKNGAEEVSPDARVHTYCVLYAHCIVLSIVRNILLFSKAQSTRAKTIFSPPFSFDAFQEYLPKDGIIAKTGSVWTVGRNSEELCVFTKK